MIYTIEYSKDAEKTLKKWKKSNPQLFKKATRILFDIMEHPRTGLGHPEPLVGGNDKTPTPMTTSLNKKLLAAMMLLVLLTMCFHFQK